MAFLQVEFFSQTLRMAVTADVILPQSTNKEIGIRPAEAEKSRFPVLWLLHGATDDHTTWQRKTSIERYAAARGLAVVMPNAHLSAYADMAHGGAFYRFVSEELPTVMRGFFPLSDQRSDNFIAGNSMGGYGAMKIGINHPEAYAAIGCFSAGAANGRLQTHGPLFTQEAWEKRQYLLYGGQSLAGTREDTWHMAEKNKGLRPLPKIFHSCGNQDFLLEAAHQTRDFFLGMEGNPYRYVYEEHEGIHEWDYWDLHIADFLQFIQTA